MGNVSVRTIDTDHALVSVTHESGGVAEVQVYLHGDELNVSVSTSHSVQTVVCVDDRDVYP